MTIILKLPFSFFTFLLAQGKMCEWNSCIDTNIVEVGVMMGIYIQWYCSSLEMRHKNSKYMW